MAKKAPRVANNRRNARRSKNVDEAKSGHSRRAILQGSATFIAGAIASGIAGISTDYFSEVARAAIPPTELADSQFSGLPVRAVALMERNDRDQAELWYFPYPLSDRPDFQRQLLEGNFADEFERWRSYYENGAADIRVSLVKLVVEGRLNGGVQIIDVRARATKQPVPESGGTQLTPGPQGAGNSSRLGFDFDRDGNDLPALAITGDPDAYSWNDDFFEDYEYFSGGSEPRSISLAFGEQQVVQIIARSTKYLVEWTIDVVLLIDGRRFVQNVQVGDQPIRTIGPRVSGDESFDEVYVYSSFAGVESSGPARSFVIVED